MDLFFYMLIFLILSIGVCFYAAKKGFDFLKAFLFCLLISPIGAFIVFSIVSQKKGEN